MTWFGEHLGCYIACVPRGCQGEVSNAGCEAPAPRLCWNWALLGKLGPSQNTRHFGERGRDGDGGGSWVSPKCLLVISHLTLVGFPCVSRERRGIQEHLFPHWLFQAWSIPPLSAHYFQRAFAFFFPWKLHLFFKRIDFLWVILRSIFKWRSWVDMKLLLFLF